VSRRRLLKPTQQRLGASQKWMLLLRQS
jgi:hypothetical protein